MVSYLLKSSIEKKKKDMENSNSSMAMCINPHTPCTVLVL